MEEDIQNYSPTVMFRGTPCIFPIQSLSLNYLFVTGTTTETQTLKKLSIMKTKHHGSS